MGKESTLEEYMDLSVRNGTRELERVSREMNSEQDMVSFLRRNQLQWLGQEQKMPAERTPNRVLRRLAWRQ